MKKKLLFIIPALGSGGAEKSLVTLLTLLESEKYDVDLLLFRREGLFLPCVPEWVNVIDAGEKYRVFDGSAATAIKRALKRLDWRFALSRIKYSRALSANDRAATWRTLKTALPKLQKHYDAAIAYLEGNAVYYCAEFADADIKIGYIHNDYNKLGLDPEFDRPFIQRLNYLVSVSPECSRVLTEVFPESKEKIRTIENITSPAVLGQMANEAVPEYENVSCLKLLTVGRLNAQKGYDIAVEAAKKLIDDGLKFKWFVIGAGDLKSEIDAAVKQNGLEGSFILLGERANPYPYVVGCDIYVQPSRFEGKSIAIDEAKCLHKPIVSTKFTTVFDQLANGENALLAEIEPGDLAEKIKALAASPALRQAFSDNLAESFSGNEQELEKFRALIEGENNVL